MKRYVLILLALACSVLSLLSQDFVQKTYVKSESQTFDDYFKIEGKKIEVIVPGSGLNGNLLGDSPDRKVSIYLPPGYENTPNNHYPVIYFLHGFTQDHDKWWGGGMVNTDFKSIMDDLITMNQITPMIVVVPSSNNKYNGSWYTNSTVTGKWEDFIIHDVVNYIDANYRTIPTVESRGIAGHSMGGYGTIKLGMRNPNIFSTVYALSPAYMVLEDVVLGTMKSNLIAAVNSTNFNGLAWQAQTAVAAAAAFAPNPASLPYYGEFPVTKDGVVIDSIWQKWLEHDPYTMISTYKDSLLRLRAIQFDCGTADLLLFDANVHFSQALHDQGIEHIFQEYDGNHTNKINQRVTTRMLPFLSEHLVHNIPGILSKSTPFLETKDTLVVEMDEDGIIYLVPDSTIAVLDTLAKYQTASAIATANTEVKILMTDIDLGAYTVYGVDTTNNTVTIPIHIAVVNDPSPPVLVIEENEVNLGDSIIATSSKGGTIYLVIPNTPPDISSIMDPNRSLINVPVEANNPVKISTGPLQAGRTFWIYVVDTYGRISDPVTVDIIESTVAIKPHRSKGIQIYPNPTYDLITVQTTAIVDCVIAINSTNGELIYSENMEGTTHQIDLSSFLKGVYLITIRSEDFITTQKIIKLL